VSILDYAVLIGRPESPYGTAATLTRAYEATGDQWKRNQKFVESEGFRAGMQTLRSDRRKPVNLGAEGSVELEFMDRGMGLILVDAFGTVTGPSAVSGTTFDSVFQTNKDGPANSLTVQLIRPFADNSGTQQFTYTGAVVTGWELTAEQDKYLKMKLDYHARNEDISTGAGTPTYPAALPFQWDQVTTSTVGATAIDFKSIKLKADYGLNTERRFLKSGAANAQQKQPRIGKRPEITGELEAEFLTTAEYTRFVNGTVMAAQFIWTGTQIDASPLTFFTLTLDLAAIQYSGETPEWSPSDLPKQSLPFVVLHDGTNPAVKFTYRSNSATH
jgi:Phage tail tube protein